MSSRRCWHSPRKRTPRARPLDAHRQEAPGGSRRPGRHRHQERHRHRNRVGWRSRFFVKRPVFPAFFCPAGSETARPPGGIRVAADWRNDTGLPDNGFVSSRAPHTRPALRMLLQVVARSGKLCCPIVATSSKLGEKRSGSARPRTGSRRMLRVMPRGPLGSPTWRPAGGCPAPPRRVLPVGTRAGANAATAATPNLYRDSQQSRSGRARCSDGK
jgi:hypothetical protein